MCCYLLADINEVASHRTEVIVPPLEPDICVLSFYGCGSSETLADSVRKKIFVDCLIEFMDVKNNWPISDQDFVIPNEKNAADLSSSTKSISKNSLLFRKLFTKGVDLDPGLITTFLTSVLISFSKNNFICLS